MSILYHKFYKNLASLIIPNLLIKKLAGVIHWLSISGLACANRWIYHTKDACIIVFKPGAYQPMAGAHLVSRNHITAGVCVCVMPRGHK